MFSARCAPSVTSILTKEGNGQAVFPLKHQCELHKVHNQQGIAEMCFVCGEDNDLGLHAQYLELDDGSLMGIFKPNPKLQSYPDRMHGGVSAAILDETLGRTLLAVQPNAQAVTIELNLKYRKPVPLGEEIRAVAHIVKARSRTFDAQGCILLSDGSVAMEATGRFAIMTSEQVGLPDGTNGLHPDTREFPDEVEI